MLLTTQSFLHFIFQFFIWNGGKPGILYEGFGFRKDRDSKKLANQDAELMILEIPWFFEDGSIMTT